MTELWFRRFGRADEDAVRLLCFPFAGGSASYYHRLSKTLRPSVDVVAVQYPGRQDRWREPVVDDLGQLADEIAGPARDLVGARLAFFGHSMGAIVAFEVVRRLDVEPVAFIASGRRAPSRSMTANKRLLDDEGLLAEVDRLGAVDRRLLDRPDARRLMMPILRGDYRAIETYEYRPVPPLSCPVRVLAGSADPMTTAEDLQAWRVHTSGEFSLQVFSGGHFFLDDHHVEVAATIRESVVGKG